MKISRVTGFPFHPPTDKREGTIHVLMGILHARNIIVTLSVTRIMSGIAAGGNNYFDPTFGLFPYLVQVSSRHSSFKLNFTRSAARLGMRPNNRRNSMVRLDAGDFVRLAGSDYEMVIIGCADDEPKPDEDDCLWFCVWEAGQQLYEQVFTGKDLILVQKERRRIPRGGNIRFPVRQTSDFCL